MVVISTASDQHQPASSRAIATLAMAGFFLRVDELDPALVQSAVALVAAGSRCGGSQVPAVAHGLADPVAGAVVPGGLDQQPARVGVAGLGDRPLRPGAARRSTRLGTRPTKEPMVLPVNRCQSPISTASANPVSVLTPRRQPSRRTSGVNSRRRPSHRSARAGRGALVTSTFVVESNASWCHGTEAWRSQPYQHRQQSYAPHIHSAAAASVRAPPVVVPCCPGGAPDLRRRERGLAPCAPAAARPGRGRRPAPRAHRHDQPRCCRAAATWRSPGPSPTSATRPSPASTCTPSPPQAPILDPLNLAAVGHDRPQRCSSASG